MNEVWKILIACLVGILTLAAFVLSLYHDGLLG